MKREGHVLDEVLKLASTHDKRELIKWCWRCNVSTRMLVFSSHCSLTVRRARGKRPWTSSWPRTIHVQFGGRLLLDQRRDNVDCFAERHKAAMGGCAQFWYARRCLRDASEQQRWLEKAVALGEEPQAMWYLARRLWNGGCELDRLRAKKLWQG